MTELRPKYALAILLKISGLSRSTYYYNLKNCDSDLKNTCLMEHIKRIFTKHKSRYGYRRITIALRNEGVLVNHKKVKRLMSRMNLFACSPKVKYKSYKGNQHHKCSNELLVRSMNHKHTVLKRNFSTSQCNQKWTTDVSEFRIAAGKLYLSPILDMHTREIISYTISSHPNFIQIKTMLEQAFDQHEDLYGVILHSDQGWQYQMHEYRNQLKAKGIIQSMSRKGNCLDNSPMENFFGIMKKEMFYGFENTFKTLSELKSAMEEYIHYYNNQRISLKLKGLTPVQYRHQSLFAI